MISLLILTSLNCMCSKKTWNGLTQLRWEFHVHYRLFFSVEVAGVGKFEFQYDVEKDESGQFQHNAPGNHHVFTGATWGDE